MENKKFSFYTTLSIENALQELHATQQGLSQQEVNERLKIYGLNEIKEVDITWFDVLKGQLLSPFMCIFFVIGLAYLLTGKVAECIIIFLIIAVNVGIGFFQEYRSNTAMQALKKCLMSQVTVKRDGQEMNVDINQLVPGDIMILSAGDIIHADCCFNEVHNLTVNETSLTGESIAVVKHAEAMKESVTDMYKAENIGFTGTVVTHGKGTAVVIGTGSHTALGTLATLTNQVSSKSSLEKGSVTIARFTIYLIFFSLLLTALVHIIVHKGELDFVDFFLFAAALTITAIPEGLPMVITFCLSQGAASLKKNNVIVKRLSAIGDLGSIEVFCTDKTGTLTENALTVDNIYGADADATLMYAVLSSPVQSATKESTAKGFDLALQKKLTPEHTTYIAQYNLVKDIAFTSQKPQTMTLEEKKSKLLAKLDSGLKD